VDINLLTDIHKISWEELANLFELAPLGKKRDPQKLEIAFQNSLLRVFAFHDAKLVLVEQFLMVYGVQQFMMLRSYLNIKEKESEARLFSI
jgi:hypothetical protein